MEDHEEEVDSDLEDDDSERMIEYDSEENEVIYSFMQWDIYIINTIINRN